MANLVYGEFEVPFDAIPEANKVVMCTRQLKHMLQNEAAAKVGLMIRTEIGNKDADKSVLEAFRASNPDKVAGWMKDIQAKLVDNVLHGELGVRTSGPRKDPLEARVEKLVEEYVRKSLLKMKGSDGKPVKLPAPKDADKVLTFLNGDQRTRTTLLANAHASQGEKLRALAVKQLRDEERLQAQSTGDEAATPESLGI